ncbi:MAG: hypothetical protein R2788_16000 [Saprospiraceae bacterium]
MTFTKSSNQLTIQFFIHYGKEKNNTWVYALIGLLVVLIAVAVYKGKNQEKGEKYRQNWPNCGPSRKRLKQR